jgi:hypothetical protein
MNFPRLTPRAIGNDELNRRSFLHHQRLVQFHRIIRGIKQKRPIPRGQEIFQVESFSSFTAYPHFAVDQCSYREQTGIAVARKFSMMNDQTNLSAQFNSRQHVAQAQSPRRCTYRARLFYTLVTSQLQASSLISVYVVGHFYQIHIWVTEIHRHHQPSGAISFDWATDQIYAAEIQVGDNVGKRHGSNKANIG